MFGPEEGGVTETSWSGKMSAPDHNNQFPCALLRTGFRFAFTQSAVLKGALFRKQRGQESQVRLTFSFIWFWGSRGGALSERTYLFLSEA